MNILLTCAGRRNYLIEYFARAVGTTGKVFAADSNPNAPALQEAAQPFLVPSVTDPDYITSLLGICRENKVRLLISLNDLELPVLSRRKGEFEAIGCTPVISSPEVIDICFDKWTTAQFLLQHGIPGPKTFIDLPLALKALESGELTFPVVLKPRWGTASIGIDYPEDLEDLNASYSFLRKRIFKTIIGETSRKDPDHAILIQEKLPGKEFGLDVINDLAGQHVFVSCKQKLAMRAGETDRAVTIENKQLREIGTKIGNALGHVGNLDCDVFEKDGNYFVLECNPRFGGGYPFSYMAGVDLPSALVRWADGAKDVSDCFNLETGVASSKCDRLVLVRSQK